MKLNILLIVILCFFVLFVTGQAYAPCIEGPGINCNNYPPPSLAQIKFDKLNYETSDKPIVTIIGAPDAVTHLEIDDLSSNIMFTHDINMAPNGTVNYVLDISSYKPGAYSVIATSFISKLTTSFTVDLMPTGGHMFLNTAKNSYLPRDHVIILGAMNPNTLVQLSLIDPNGIPVESAQTFSDNTGHFSLFNFTIPTNAISGVWKIGTTRGVEHVQIQITVNSTLDGNSNIKVGTVTSSPLKQFKSGVTTQNIICKAGFALTIKKEGHLPACVNPDTVSRLVLYGWSENPLNELFLRYGNQTQANNVFFDIMNEPKIRNWSETGWRYSDYIYASNGDTHQSSATVRLYVSSHTGAHPECENGSYGLVVVNLTPVAIEHNYTKAGCEIDQTTNESVDPESNVK